MKIGILTYHRTLNYGACLQAIATRVVLESMGHEVFYVDYWPKYHSRTYEAFSWSKLFSLNYKSAFIYLIDSLKYYKYRKLRIQNFEVFFERYIYPYCRPVSEKYDVIVYGSDQIWRKQPALRDYNPIYFGVNCYEAKRHIAYSASMGILPQKEIDLQKVKEYVGHLDKIAVREQDLKSLLEKMGVPDVTLTLDPTLLLSSIQWEEVIPIDGCKKEKYVLVYGINNVSFDMSKIYRFAKKHDCTVKILSGTAQAKDTQDLITTANPYQFVRLIKNAEFVFTSSFHGLAFSIIYHKEFFTSYPKNSNRAITLLDIVGVKDRNLAPNSDIPDFCDKIDYVNVEERLKLAIKESCDYLSEEISIIKGKAML